MPTVPLLESLERIGRERAVPVYAHHAMEHRLDRSQPQGEVRERREVVRQRAHKVGVGQHAVAKTRRMGAVSDAGSLDDVAHLHVMRARHFATLAVEAQFERLVEELHALQSVAFIVRPRLFWARIVGLHGRDGAVDRANGAFETLFEVERTFAFYLCFVCHCLTFQECCGPPARP